MDNYHSFGEEDLYEGLFSSEGGPVFAHRLFSALMSPDEKELDKVVDEMERMADRRKKMRAALSDDIRYEVKELRAFRTYYGRRQGDYTPEQREMIHAYDNNWTEDIVRRLLGRKTEPLEEETPALNAG
ncbi:MAG: hypothetical protein WC612_06185 [Bdellovibrionales bacterium]|jgi:hypothetical protein